MKELTIEEKAQKYDEAIERGKSLLSDNKIGNAWIYKLLPELAESEDEKESEDERIRKQLKAFIHSRASLITQSKHDSWLAWLEKQGEQNTAWSEEDEEMIQALNACINAAIKGGMNYISFDSKSILIGKVKNWLKSLKDRVQPKQEWSEEDITRINEIIETLNIVQANRVRTQRMHYSKATIDKNIDWLKSLKDRVQPKVEWSSILQIPT